MTSVLRLQAPAKVNLYLRILGKRPDGYHEIETLFERIDLADELAFAPQASGLTLTCDDPGLSCGEDNLVLQAARLLQRVCAVGHGAAIRLTKRIPIAAGLGGGSSDAATTLVGLNQLWNTRRSVSQLCELAAQLGSDVPFFLSGSPMAIGRGRGERCEAIDGAPSLSHVLVVPDARLSTKDIYAGWETTRAQGAAERGLTATSGSLSMVVHALRNGPAMAGLAHGLWNDLEPEAIRRCPVIQRIQADLRAKGCVSAHVSGSGPSVFGLCADPRQARDIADSMRQGSPPSWRVEAIQTDPQEHGCQLTSRGLDS